MKTPDPEKSEDWIKTEENRKSEAEIAAELSRIHGGG
jgi:hypothetical protein